MTTQDEQLAKNDPSALPHKKSYLSRSQATTSDFQGTSKLLEVFQSCSKEIMKYLRE